MYNNSSHFMNTISALLKYTQPVLVKREDPNSRQNTVKEIQNRAQTGEWPQILIFPEGTCTNRSCLISFKLGMIFLFPFKRGVCQCHYYNVRFIAPDLVNIDRFQLM